MKGYVDLALQSFEVFGLKVKCCLREGVKAGGGELLPIQKVEEKLKMVLYVTIH